MSSVRIEWLHIGIGQLADRAGPNLPSAVIAVIPSFAVGATATAPVDRPVAPGIASDLPVHGRIHALDKPVIVAWGADPTAAENSGLRVEPGSPVILALAAADKLSFITTTDAASLVVAQAHDTPLGFSQIASLSSAVGLGAIPSGATRAIIGVENQTVRWCDDGSNPTASVGMLLGPGDTLEYDGTLSAIRFIETTAGAKLNASFYS